MDVGEVELSNGKVYKLEWVETKTRTASAKVVDGNTIVIKIPRMLRGEMAKDMFTRLKRRIVASLEKHPERFETHVLSYTDGQQVNMLGRLFTVRVESKPDRAYSSAKIDGDMIVARMQNYNDNKLLTRLVIRTLSKEMLPSLVERINYINQQYVGAKIAGVRIRDNASRWGSYSRKSRSISINFKLLYAPQEVIDYVIVHELCHTKAANHSQRFWGYVQAVLPDYKDRKRWLRKNGDTLGVAEKQNTAGANNVDFQPNAA